MQDECRGRGRVLLKKKSNDPTSRAFFTTIIHQQRHQRRNSDPTSSQIPAIDGADGPVGSDDMSGSADSGITHWCVCVHNVSPEQPYTVFKTHITASARDVIAQAMQKARRKESPSEYVLVEEVVVPSYLDSPGGSSRRRPGGKMSTRVLDDDEVVYSAQKDWNTSGKLVLFEKSLVFSDNGRRLVSVEQSSLKVDSTEEQGECEGALSSILVQVPSRAEVVRMQ